MKTKSVITRLLALLILMIMIGTTVTSFYNFKHLKTILQEEIREEVFIILETMDWAIRPLLLAGNDEEIQRMVSNVADYPIIDRIRLYNSESIVLYSNEVSEIGQLIKNPCVSGIFINNSQRKSKEDIGGKIFEAAIPVGRSEMESSSGENIQAVLFISVDMDYIINLWNGLAYDFQVIYSVINVILILMIILYIYFAVGKPLHYFKAAAEAITDKNYDYTISAKMQGEFEDLKIAYNTMRNSIKENAMDLNRALLEAEEASEAKLTFLTNMSHEIRTPLNSILGFAELLTEQEADPEKKSELAIIHKSGTHLLSVINDLLDFSKIESNQMEIENINFSIREMLRDTSDFFYIQVRKKNLEFTYEVSRETPYECKGDMNKIRQILINLIHNAIKFTRFGEIHVTVDYIDGQLVIKVMDTGIGVEEAKQKLIFEAFLQSDNSIARKYGGTGLGLSICKRFANLLGGDIWVESVLGEGSTFTVKVNAEPIKSKQFQGRGMLCAWLNADSEIGDLVYKTVLTLPERQSKLEEVLNAKDSTQLASQIHALKGLTGNFQMTELYNLFVSADKEMKKESPDYAVIKELLNETGEIIVLVSEAAENHCRINPNVSTEKKYTHTSTKYVPTTPIVLESVDHKIPGLTSVEEMTLLVAEDIKENQLLIDKILGKMVRSIDYVSNGIQAMEALFEKRYDCLLLDIQMPEMSGEDVLVEVGKLKKKNPELEFPYIIVISAHATIQEKTTCMNLGADDYISKPINKEKLRNKIRSLVSM